MVDDKCTYKCILFIFLLRDDVCFFISQSGETADTLGALR